MRPPDRAWLVDAVRPLVGPVRSIEPLPAGSSGQSYLVTTAGGRYVAKRFAVDAPVLLGPAAQYALLETLAATRLAPRAIGSADRLLVTEYVEGRVPDAADLRGPRRIEPIAAALRRLHRVVPEIPSFAPRRYAADYVSALGGRDALGPADRGRYDELLALGDPFAGRDGALCHNDLTADNMLFGERGLTLIDFDYAVLAPPIVDLASLVTLNSLPGAATARLLDAYFDGAAPFSVTEFDRVQRLMRLLAHFWSLASGQPDSVLKYGIRNV